MKLGFTLFNFHSVIKSLDDLDSVLSKLHDMGVSVVQVSGIGFLSNYDVADVCKKYDMEVCLTHMPLDRIINDTDALIDEHKALGCKTIGVGWIPDKYHSAEGMKQFIQDMTPAAKKIKEAGMQFAYHNHQFEFERYDNGKTAMQMLIEADPDLFNFILDIHWVQTGGGNPVDYIHKVAGRMSVCHFKDYRIIVEPPQKITLDSYYGTDDFEIVSDRNSYIRDFAEIGTGNIDIDACYKACKESGVEYIIIEQDRCSIDVFESAKISWENLNKIAKQNS